jgi:hypothetical protein
MARQSLIARERKRLCNLTGEEFLGNLSRPTQSPASFSAFLFSAYLATSFSRLRSLAINDCLAIPVLFSER